MNIIAKRKIFYIISAILAIASILFLVVWGLNFGIDFRGGSLIELKFDKGGEVDTQKIEEIFSGYEFKSLGVQKSASDSVLIRTDEIDDEKFTEIKSRIKTEVGEFEEVRFETVGPTIGSDLRRKAIIAVVVASIVIIIYLAIVFRKVPKPANSWRFGVAAIIALIHDILFVTGLFAVLGHFYTSIVVDSLFITALLTVMGFSVNDTIVVFDRLRENLRRLPFDGRNFDYIANESVKQTIARSINTSLTVIVILLAIILFGGETMFSFILALLAGVVIGTYSSIFIATAVLVDWTNLAIRRSK